MSKDKKNKEEASEVIDELMNLIFGDDQGQGEEQGDKTIFADLLPDEETRKKQERDKNIH
jgi:polyhydroxyalkanoate synthesis regulator phasin